MITTLTVTYSKKLNEDEMDQLIQSWAMVLEDYSLRDIALGFKAVMKKKFMRMPTPADLIELMPSTADVKVEAERIWAGILETMARYGSTESIEFNPPWIADFINNSGGWKVFCERTHSELVWDKKNFIEQFETLSQSNSKPKILKGSFHRITEVKSVNLIDSDGRAKQIEYEPSDGPTMIENLKEVFRDRPSEKLVIELKKRSVDNPNAKSILGMLGRSIEEDREREENKYKILDTRGNNGC